MQLLFLSCMPWGGLWICGGECVGVGGSVHEGRVPCLSPHGAHPSCSSSSSHGVLRAHNWHSRLVAWHGPSCLRLSTTCATWCRSSPAWPGVMCLWAGPNHSCCLPGSWHHMQGSCIKPGQARPLPCGTGSARFQASGVVPATGASVSSAP